MNISMESIRTKEHFYGTSLDLHRQKQDQASRNPFLIIIKTQTKKKIAV